MARPSPSAIRQALSRLAGSGVLALLAAASVLGLFGMPFGSYDESALLLGAKLTRAGWIPYSDFYTYYGPLGYDLMIPFLDLGSPGIAYRAAQGAALLLLTIALLIVVRSFSQSGISRWVAVLLVLAGSSAVLAQPQFLGFLGAALSFVVFFLASNSKEKRRATWLYVGTGAALAGTALIRPAFAFYAGVSLLCVQAMTDSRPGMSERIAALAGGALSSLILLWLALYSRIPFWEAVHAMVTIPAKLSSSSARFVYPLFLPPEPMQLLSVAAGCAALSLAAMSFTFSQGRVPVSVAAAGALGAGLVPMVLVSSTHPGRVGTAASFLLFAAGSAAAFLARTALARSRRLAASSVCGLASTAFLHYFWTRPDLAHLTPSVALATAAVVLAAPELPRLRARALQAALALAATLPLLFSSSSIYPAAAITRLFGQSAHLLPLSDWPAARLPADAVAAVRLADAQADPDSRFVALASNQSRTELSPVVLFLLSRRLPYTRWYAYDPGIQNSASVQRLMIEELRRSGSRTAVVWDAELFQDLRPNTGADPPTPTPIDRLARELYPTKLARYGSFEVRKRRE